MATLSRAYRTESIVYERLREGRQILLGIVRDTLRRAVRGSVSVEQAIAAVENWLDPGKAPHTMAGAPVSRRAERVLGLLPGGAGYQARRILVTESTRAHSEGRLRLARERGFLVRYMLAADHPRADTCDPAASEDGGFGPGVYRAGDAPSPPIHPLCRCSLSVMEPDASQREDLAHMRGF